MSTVEGGAGDLEADGDLCDGDLASLSRAGMVYLRQKTRRTNAALGVVDRALESQRSPFRWSVSDLPNRICAIHSERHALASDVCRDAPLTSRFGVRSLLVEVFCKTGYVYRELTSSLIVNQIAAS